MFLIRWACKLLLGIHLLIALLAILTMDTDFENATLAKARDTAIDTYEAAGFGNLFAGIAIIGVILILPWLIPMLLPGGKGDKGKGD